MSTSAKNDSSNSRADRYAFKDAEARWQAAAHLLGVDLNLLSGEAGHA